RGRQRRARGGHAGAAAPRGRQGRPRGRPGGAAPLRRRRQPRRMSGLRLQHVTKRFGPVTALDDVSLEIADGEFFTVLGPPGVERAAQTLHIVHLLKRKPGKLSGGERQRVALGRTLVRDPRALLLDEPLSALDALLRLEMRSELKRLQRELGRTTVYVTHDQVEAMSMPDRVAVLREGVVQQVDAPENIYHRPVNQFVATVVGSPPMNFIPCTLAARNGSLRVQHPLFEVEVAAERLSLRQTLP